MVVTALGHGYIQYLNVKKIESSGLWMKSTTVKIEAAQQDIEELTKKLNLLESKQ